jgi:hypothetical protein
MTALFTLLDDADDHVVKAAWDTAVIEYLQTRENDHVIALLAQIATIIDPPELCLNKPDLILVHSSPAQRTH